MARFYFYPDNNLVVVNNVPHREDFYIEAADGYLMVNIFAENTNHDAYIAPLFAVISVKNISVYGKLQLLDWGGGNYEVYYNLETLYSYKTPSAIAQNSYLTGGETYIATLFCDNAQHFICECDSLSASFDISPKLSKPEILFQPTSLGFLTILHADTPCGKYLMIVLYDGNFSVLFEAEADNIEFSQRSFTVTKSYADMLGRVRKTEYAFNNVSLRVLNESFNYTRDNHFDAQLTPYLLLEALQANDHACARTYLDDELLDMADNLTAYFGDYKRIECPKFRNFQNKNDLNEVALIYPFKQAVNAPKYYKFHLQNGKITNITN